MEHEGKTASRSLEAKQLPRGLLIYITVIMTGERKEIRYTQDNYAVIIMILSTYIILIYILVVFSYRDNA